ncbi:MAG: terpene cyclase/mutase family protein [Planctomycetes bacterium]|nr:terpene cyclase/mutase family protein [Planctomycetota bacterium]
MSETQEVQPAALAGEKPNDLSSIRTVPWVGIAFAAHVLLVVVAWFILPMQVAAQKIEVIKSSVEVPAMPPEPEREPPQEFDNLKEEVVETDRPQMQLVETPTDLINEDPTDKPTQSLAEAETNELTSDSPHPNPNSNTGVGLGGGPGGGRPGGGNGGLDYRRGPRGGPNGDRDRVPAALDWLKDHQNVYGHWSSKQFSEDSRRTNARRTYNLEFVKPGDSAGDKGWGESVDIGLTGLSMLAFTASGHDHKTGSYKETLRKAISFLRRVQSMDGCFGGKQDHEYVYNHAISTMALCEVFALSQDQMFRPLCERAVKYILQMQNPGMGWRYGEKTGENDSSVTGWMVLALKTAHTAGIDFDVKAAYAGASKWLDIVTVDYKGYPRTGYAEPGSENGRLGAASKIYDSNASLDAINMMTRMFMAEEGWDAKNRTIQSQAGVCADDPPVWQHNKLDYYYWYYASLAMFQVGGTKWDRWAKPMLKTLMDNQRGYRPEDKGSSKDSLDEHGSWDAVDAWSTSGGRVYATAINCLTLQVWYRYEKLQGGK